MAQYISKSALIAEMEKRYEYWREKEHNSHSIESEIRMSECQHLMLLLNTLEVKEVDLEKELDEWRNTHFHKNRNGLSGEYLTHEIQLAIAKHFYSLGLKAQKGEKV